jgi:small-conductance mechanosensitive channel
MKSSGFRTSNFSAAMHRFVCFGYCLNLFFLPIGQLSGAENYADETSSQLPQAEVQVRDSLGVITRSEVELIVNFTQIIEEDKNRLQTLRNDSSRLEAQFRDISLQSYNKNRLLDSLQAADAGIDTEPAAVVEQEWSQLREILDFLLERRRSIHQQIRILERKLRKEQETIEFIFKGERAAILEITEQNARQSLNRQSVADSSELAGQSLADTLNRVELIDVSRYNWRVAEAERELARRKAKFEISRQRWLLAEELLALNIDDLVLARALAASAKNQLIRWRETSASLQQELRRLQDRDSAALLQTAIARRLTGTEEVALRVAKVLRTDSTLLRNLESRVERLSAIRKPLEAAVSAAKADIDRESRWLEYLNSPFAPHRIYSFVINTAPRIVLIILLLVCVWITGRWLTRQIVTRVIRSESSEERAERVETLNRAIRSGLTTIILLGGGLILLSECGVDISVLLGGAAIISLAVAFGAQSMIKDYFSGFMIFTENQYRVGNVVRINQVSGVVEDISLRMTTLRDLEGIAHFIPHGEIKTVSNLTHSWSQVMLDLRVAYKEDIDSVMAVIMEVARTMRKDPDYENMIMNDPEMLGVDNLSESAVVVKLVIRTRPLKQWLVKRELLRRIKNRFTELSIEIPFPHQHVYLSAPGSGKEVPRMENSASG